LLIAASLLVINGCKKNDDPPPPDMVPEQSFIMDFADYSNPDDTLKQKNADSYKNWGHAFVQTAFWNNVLKTSMAIPVASFLESYKHNAVWHAENENWTWNYNFTSGGNTYYAELTAYWENINVIWEMRISKENSYEDFLWYHGSSSGNQIGGYWIINGNPQEPEELLRIDWVRATEDQWGIQYKIIKEGSQDKNSYITYGMINGEFDRYYNVYTVRYDNNTEIEWNSEDFHGRIRDAWHFLDVYWHCWNNNLQDTNCP
jgi:hypothetical protein